MRCVHAHFPINAIVAKDGKSVELKNFLGGRKIMKTTMLGDTKVKLSVDVKDELIFEGNDNAMVSLMCSQVAQSCSIGTKDERKFLDGVYVSEKSLAQPRDD
jgi:large subunit ribosomal protein L9e